MPLRLLKREPSAPELAPRFLAPLEDEDEDDAVGLPEAIAARRRDCRRLPDGGGRATGFLAATLVVALLCCCIRGWWSRVSDRGGRVGSMCVRVH